MKVSVFVTDDEATIRNVLARRLSAKGHHVQTFDSGEALLAALDYETPDIILLDLKMQGITGLEALKEGRRKAPEVLFVMLTAYGTVEDAVEAIKLGAYDFLIKSIDFVGVEAVLQRALEYLSLRRRVAFETKHDFERYALPNIVAESARTQDVIKQIKEVLGNHNGTVLLQGEPGTGKEFFARVLHYNGSRKDAPFIGMNCTVVPGHVFEHEFFGYERGAFTGADARQPGLCEQADGGTLFLDDIAELTLDDQTKLLRVLQERSVRRLGGREDIQVDFKLIAATNCDLRKEVERGRFREDLLDHLKVVTLELPLLRERVEDIIPLSLRALMRKAMALGKEITGIEAAAHDLLVQYPFPGNIRELENIIERAVIVCNSPQIRIEDLPYELEAQPVVPVSILTNSETSVVRIEMTLGEHALRNIEQAVIEEALRFSNGNKSQAAQLLGVTPYALDRRLKKPDNS